MKLSIKKMTLLFAALAVLLLVSIPADAQRRNSSRTSGGELRNRIGKDGVIAVNGRIRYSISLSQGQVVRVRVKAKNGDPAIGIIVSTNETSYGDRYKVGGTLEEDDNGTFWQGAVGATGTYYVYVFAPLSTTFRIRASAW